MTPQTIGSANPTLGSLRQAGEQKIRAAAREFESVFVAQLLDSMSAGLRTDGPFGGGHAEEAWRSSLNQEYGKVIAARGGIGVGAAIHRELLRRQEVAS